MWFAQWLPPGQPRREGRIIQWLLNQNNQLAAVIKPFERLVEDDGPTVFIPNVELDDVWDPHNAVKRKKPKKDKSK